MSYSIYTSPEFEKEISKIDLNEREVLEKIFLELKENPHIGEPLGYGFFREKRFGKRRVYYLIYDKLLAVLIVAISGKKDQQKIINSIKRSLEEDKKYVERLYSLFKQEDL